MLELLKGTGTFGELPKGNVPSLLDPCGGSKWQGFVPLSLFPALFPVPLTIPADAPLIELGDGSETFAFSMGAATHFCDYCNVETVPEPLSLASIGWNLFPCHLIECGCCYELGEYLCEKCEKLSECCNCIHCASCEDPCDSTCENCEYCSDCCNCDWCPNGHNVSVTCECGYCESHCGCSSSYCKCGDPAECGCCYSCEYCCSCKKECSVPWVERNDPMPTERNLSFKEEIAEDLTLIDPAEMMASFYLSDLAMFLANRWLRKCAGPNRRNVAFRAAIELREDAKRLQDHIIALCDPAFRLYTFAVCGGELRHHSELRNGSYPQGRSDMWDYWLDMGETIGRATLLRDAADLFASGRFPSAGYGGEKWRIVAETAAMREEGKLDPRTFVDRVFSLQHNGGSLLNKRTWNIRNPYGAGTSEMAWIGDAHHSSNYRVLLMCCSSDAADLMRRVLVFGSLLGISEDDRKMIARGMDEGHWNVPEEEEGTETFPAIPAPPYVEGCACAFCEKAEVQA